MQTDLEKEMIEKALDKKIKELFRTSPDLQAMLGCVWGKTISIINGDNTPCEETAVQIIVLYKDDGKTEVRLCHKHAVLVLAETNPHVFSEEDKMSDPIHPEGIYICEGCGKKYTEYINGCVEDHPSSRSIRFSPTI